METNDAVASHMTAITTVRSEVGPGTSGTLQTPNGPVTWVREADGTLNAKGDGQQLTVTGTDDSDGSWQRNATFSTAGAPPYLTIDSVAQNAQRLTATTLRAGQSQLTLTITGINAAVTSGTATVSGTLNGSAVNWTGPVDLTSNPLTGTAVPGWPRGAFAAQLQEASFFNPLASTLAPPSPEPVAFPPGESAGTGSGHIPVGVIRTDATGAFGHAGAWCIGGAIGGSGGGPVGALLGCLGGATGSVLSDLWDWINQGSTPVDPFPPPDLPVEPEPVSTGPITQTSTEDPPPPPPPDPPPPPGDPDPGDQAPAGSDDTDGDSSDGGGSGSGGEIDDRPGLDLD